ncbi:MAG: imidazole glycerol phosphate synthase subunit HisH [Candidatus Omnitrophota bacterium]
MVHQNILIVDYQCGNLFSIQRALKEIGVSSFISSSANEIRGADKIILPGVGAFGDGMEKLTSFGLKDAVLASIAAGRYILGICLGMQLLFDESFEFGHYQGLQLIPGSVTRLREEGSAIDEKAVKVPHIGWNAIRFTHEKYSSHKLFQGVPDETYMYFLHSFGVRARQQEHCVAMTEYGDNKFCAIALHENIIGVQFHPEISGLSGLQLLKNFVSV